MRETTLELRKHKASQYGEGITLQSLRRFVVSAALWCLGVVAIFGALVNAALLVIVPVFSLENASRNHTDNPITVTNLTLNLVVGVAAIAAARGSHRTRLLIGMIAVSAALLYGLYDLGASDEPG